MTTEIKVKYYASSALTFTSLGSLAASATWVAGAESGAVDNSSNLYDDYLLSANFKVGAANGKVGRFEVWVIPMLDDTNWPGVFDGTDSTETTTADEKYGCGKLAGAVTVSVTTADLIYPMAPVSVAQLFGGVCPRKFSVFVTHDAQTSTNAIAAASSTVNIVSITPVTWTQA